MRRGAVLGVGEALDALPLPAGVSCGLRPARGKILHRDHLPEKDGAGVMTITQVVAALHSAALSTQRA